MKNYARKMVGNEWMRAKTRSTRLIKWTGSERLTFAFNANRLFRSSWSFFAHFFFFASCFCFLFCVCCSPSSSAATTAAAAVVVCVCCVRVCFLHFRRVHGKSTQFLHCLSDVVRNRNPKQSSFFRNRMHNVGVVCAQRVVEPCRGEPECMHATA